MKYIYIILSVVLTITTGAWVNHYNAELKNTDAPFHIVSLELAWTADNASKVLSSWTDDNRRAAVMGIYTDYFFIVAYTSLLAFSVWYSSYHPKQAPLARRMIVLTIMAGLCDVVENLFMLPYLKQSQGIVWAFSLPASIKFTLLFLVILYVFRQIFNRIRHKILKVSQ